MCFPPSFCIFGAVAAWSHTLLHWVLPWPRDYQFLMILAFPLSLLVLPLRNCFGASPSDCPSCWGRLVISYCLLHFLESSRFLAFALAFFAFYCSDASCTCRSHALLSSGLRCFCSSTTPLVSVWAPQLLAPTLDHHAHPASSDCFPQLFCNTRPRASFHLPPSPTSPL